MYVSFENGSVGVLTASSLCLRCQINISAYLPPYPCQSAYPLVIAAHPSEPNQFAIGLTDGGVCVIEPLETVVRQVGHLTSTRKRWLGKHGLCTASSDQPQRDIGVYTKRPPNETK
ncbi:topless-related protein 4-like [Forsythia ovata]|uniref:Topless-related protein 4-like n=1 Tax=Forsythia ovata TaxID=205694 RepID=A0ABD1SIZ7_9LAMI